MYCTPPGNHVRVPKHVGVRTVGGVEGVEHGAVRRILHAHVAARVSGDQQQMEGVEHERRQRLCPRLNRADLEGVEERGTGKGQEGLKTDRRRHLQPRKAGKRAAAQRAMSMPANQVTSPRTCSRNRGLVAPLHRARAASISRSRCALRVPSCSAVHGATLCASSSRHALA
jgi:hypothetical protein